MILVRLHKTSAIVELACTKVILDVGNIICHKEKYLHTKMLILTMNMGPGPKILVIQMLEV